MGRGNNRRGQDMKRKIMYCSGKRSLSERVLIPGLRA
jgi:hypothetical protein